MTRVERLVNLIAALLDTRRGLTAEEIRYAVAGYDSQPSYEAFRRAFERDKATLKELGIPVETVELDPFDPSRVAYRIPKSSYYLPELGLEPEELAALRLAAQAVMGAGERAASGLMKLAAGVMPGSFSEPRVLLGADLAAEHPLLALVYQAFTERRRIRFDYQRAGSDEIEQRTVETYGLVHRRGHWYIVGRDLERDAPRSFRVSRICSDVELLSETYQVPAGVRAAEQLDIEPWEVGSAEPVTAVVRFDAELAWWPAQNLPDAPQRHREDGAVEVELAVANLDALVTYVLGFGESFEIVSPPEARAALRARLAPYLEDGR